MKAALAFVLIPLDTRSPQLPDRLREFIAEAQKINEAQPAESASDPPPFWTYFIDNPRPNSTRPII